MNEYSKYIIPALIVASLVVAFLIVQPFIVPIITAGIIAYAFRPVYNFVYRHIKYPTISALLVVFVILFLVSAPAFIIVNTLSREAYVLYVLGKEILLTDDLFSLCTYSFCSTFRELFDFNSVNQSIQTFLSTATEYLRENAAQFFLAIPRKALEVFIIGISTFYLLRDGDHFVDAIKRMLASKTAKAQIIMTRLNDVLHGVIYGSLVVAFIQGLLGTLAFAIFGISSPLTWGVLMFFFALIPYLGTFIVWLPAGLFLLFDGIASSDYFVIGRAVGLLLFGALILSTIDNLLKPKIIGQHIRTHPLIVMFGVFGGLVLFGVAGVIIGPVVLAMTITLIKLYVEPVQK